MLKWRFCSERSSDVSNIPQMSSTELKFMNFCQYLKTEMHGSRLGCDFGEHRWSFGHFAASGGAAYPAREVCQAAQALQSRVDSRNLRWVSSNHYFDKSKKWQNWLRISFNEFLDTTRAGRTRARAIPEDRCCVKQARTHRGLFTASLPGDTAVAEQANRACTQESICTTNGSPVSLELFLPSTTTIFRKFRATRKNEKQR